LTPEIGLVGHGGWGDGRLGSYYSSTVRLNDFKLIEELKGRSRDELLFRLTQLGDEAAAHGRYCQKLWMTVEGRRKNKKGVS
ncbi:MAG: hypothetical protein QGH77_08240, partial [Planctomycetota bacterium]|nr:hypothetical protein [Planctomycetota bacterium]